MKKILFFIVIIFLNINLYSYENVKWIRTDLPEMPANDIRNLNFSIENTVFLDVMFLEDNPNYGWVSGFNSLILKTTDAGKTWDYVIIDRINKYQLEMVYFVNEKVGYASGPCNNCPLMNGGIFKSEDGGNTWRNITPVFNTFQGIFLTSTTLPLWGCYFIDENEGYLVGGECGTAYNIGVNTFRQAFYKTNNGGNNWTLTTADVVNSKLADVIVDKEGVGWAISSGILWRSNPERTEWSDFSETGGRDWHEDISKYNDSFIVPVSTTCSGNDGENGGIRITTDLGESWINFNTQAAMYGSLMVDDLTGWGVGHKASVYQTTSGGIEWKNINTCLEGGDFIDDLALTSDGVYWLVGDHIWFSKPAIFDTLTRQYEVIDVCYGDRLVLDLDTNVQNISWNVNSFSSTFEFDAVVSRTITAEYFDKSCPDTVYKSIFEINVLPLPDYMLTISDEEPCEGDEVILSINPIYSSYRWFNNTKNEELSFSSYSATITETGTYSVSIVDEYFCEHSLEIPVFFNPLPEINLDSIGRITFCLGDTLLLIANHNGIEVNWYEDGDDEVLSRNDTLIVLESGDYYALITSPFGCTITSQMIFARAIIDTNNFQLTAEFTGNWFESDIVEKDEFICEFLSITNHRTIEAIIRNPIILGNTEFSIPSAQLPLIIPPKQTIELEVCFLGIGKEIRMDTILIVDRCSDHYLPLKAIIKDKVVNSNSKCELDLDFVNVSLVDRYFITMGLPYPNPSIGFSEFQFIEFIPYTLNHSLSIKLYDLFGVFIKDLNFIELQNEPQRNGVLVKSICEIDLSGLVAGVYLIQIESPQSIEILRILKN